MIFREELINKILAGEKTVTRRPVQYDIVVGALPCHYKPGGGPGGTYALQGPPEKGSRARARTIPGYRLRVLSVRRERLGAPEAADMFTKAAEARGEGFKTWADLADYWRGLYGSYEPDQLVDRIEFELVEVPS